jgi:hypothetical protein
VPNVINYQGMLRQPDGTPINGTYSMTFRLYDEPTLGTLFHTETLTEVVVHDGLFTVLLGDADGNPIAAVAFQNRLYASIQVEGDAEMEPRQRIAPVPYAVQLTDGVYVGEAGNVGVGNTDPLADTSLLVGPATGGRHLTLNDIPTARWGFATGGHDLSVQSDYGGSWAERVRFTESGNLESTGDVRAAGSVRGRQTYRVFFAEAEGEGAEVNTYLDRWDLCTLLSYEVSGVDDSRGDWGKCMVSFNSDAYTNWGNLGPLSFQASALRPQWHLHARADPNVNSVLCEAICLNFE